MSKIQAVLFSKKEFNKKTADKWLWEHALYPKKLHRTKNLLRYRIKEPKPGFEYRLITLAKGVKAVIMFKR